MLSQKVIKLNNIKAFFSKTIEEHNMTFIEYKIDQMFDVIMEDKSDLFAFGGYHISLCHYTVSNEARSYILTRFTVK